jgi:hypothetical protein
LDGLIYEITYEGFSGVANVKVSEEVDRKTIEESLEAQGSDRYFFSTDDEEELDV